MKQPWVALLLTAALAACADPRATAEDIAHHAGFVASDIQTASYRLRSYRRPATGATLRIYIEGDGHAWRTQDTPSNDPTPWSPVALELAARDPAQAVAWLGRPCQYVRDDPSCDVSAWTSARYAEAVVRAMNQAIDALKHAAGAHHLELVGFSGGGALAALLSERRGDVESLRTVAANLDTRAWTEEHHVSPLSGSLNPADFAAALATLPQVHFVGGDDGNVDPAVTQSFLRHMGPSACVKVRIEPGRAHTGDWAARWPALLDDTPGCAR